MVEMTLGLLIPCLPAIATLCRGVVSPMASRIAEQAHSIINHRDAEARNLVQMNTGAHTPATNGEGSYRESKGLQPTRQASHGSDADFGALLGLGPHQILKTTEFEIRPSTSGDLREVSVARPEWDGSAWV